MARGRDVGGYFEKLTRRGAGGRRLDVDGEPDGSTVAPRPSAPPSTERSGRGPGGGGITDALRDALGRGRRSVESTTARVRERTKRRAPRRAELPPEGVVTIEYSPCLDGDPDPGEVVWTWVPFEEDPDQGKDRPVVVVGRRGERLVGVPLTTRRSNREAQISLGSGRWDPKRRESYARIWRMLDIDPDRMRREGAVLDRRRFDALVAAVDEYYDVHRVEVSGDEEFGDGS